MSDTVKREPNFFSVNRYDGEEQRVIRNFIESANARGYTITYSNLAREDEELPALKITNGGLNVDLSKIGAYGNEDEYLRIYDADKRFMGIVSLNNGTEPVAIATDYQDGINKDLLTDLVEASYLRFNSLDITRMPSRFTESEFSSIESVIEDGLKSGYKVFIENRGNDKNEILIENDENLSETVRDYGKLGVPAILGFSQEGKGVTFVQATPTYDGTDNVPFLALRRAYNPEAAAEINDFIENTHLVTQFVKNAKNKPSTPEI